MGPTVVIASPHSPQTQAARIRARGHATGELVAALAGIWALTALAALAAVLAPALAPDTRPHPALHGSLGDAIAILAGNLRVLAAPFVLAWLGFAHTRRARAFADLLVAAVVAVNTIRVGLALGRYGNALIAYVPQLPLEWLALALSASGWLAARRERLPARALTWRALQTLAAAVLAAAVETLATPHL